MSPQEMEHMLHHLIDVHGSEQISTGNRVTESRRSLACYDFVQRDSSGGACRGRVVETVIYPTFDKRHFSIVQSILKSDCHNYAMILHNRDKVYCDTAIVQKDDEDVLFDRTDLSFYVPPDDIFYKTKKEHLHLVMYNPVSTTTNTAFAKKYGINSNMVRVYGNLHSRLSYLTHAFNDDKYRYDECMICATNYMWEHYRESIESVKLTTCELLNTVEDILRNVALNNGYIDMNIARRVLHEYHLGHFYIKEYYKIRDIVMTLQYENECCLPDKKQRDHLAQKEKQLTNILELYRKEVRNNELLTKENIELKEKNELLTVRNKEPPKQKTILATDNTLNLTDWLSDVSENPFT